MENYNDSIGINFENIFCNSEVVNNKLRLINLSLKNGKRIKTIFSACINIDFKKYAIYESYITNEYTQVSDGVGKGKLIAGGRNPPDFTSTQVRILPRPR